ncbi:MAG TPA: VOC family protein [Acidimicrobiales bacterium]|nr:VOC family protein [Acidimicrobiales bacterium]
MPATFNHVAHCVTDLDRSRRFYQELLGFEMVLELRPPDQPTDRLLRLDAPLGMTAVYLRRDGLMLELMSFDRPGNPPVPDRVVNEPGLTHLSFSVDDIDATAARAAELGGEVLADTHVGGAVFVRDPDGQLIELLPMSFRKLFEGR